MTEPAAATSQTTIFAFLVFSVYICIGIVTGNSERVDNPLKSFTVLDVFPCVLLFSDGQFDGPI